jgi:hypothetical protein
LVAAVVAIPFLTDSVTTYLTVGCAVYFATCAYLLMKRRWWAAAAITLASGQPVLNLISHERPTRFENDLVIGLALVGVAILAVGPTRKKMRARESQPDR